MAKKSFSDELAEVRKKGTHKAARKFIKKRGLEVRHLVSRNGSTIYNVLRKDDTVKGGYKPLSIVIHEPNLKDRLDAKG